ncbi:MAG: hypothetical protein E7473_03000 [Ruminococcaceae bacterium]|nr:hypothetical protein [Oscillospiraceae bacterium]
MKKIVSLLLSACLLSCLLVACSGDEKGSEEKGTPLTLENYEQYLKIHTYDTDAGFRFDVNPVTTNYDFNDVELVVKATGTYDTNMRVFSGELFYRQNDYK